jgi:8-oxo-dGTP pyrophosphatase MutT (NUDIX family)
MTHVRLNRRNGLSRLSGSWDFSRITSQITREASLSPALRSYVRVRWDEYLRKHPGAYDGRLLRLENIHLSNQTISIAVSETRFSHYIASRAPLFTDHFSETERADPLGMTAVIRTSDHQYLIGVRSEGADQNPGQLYFVGGFPEIGTSASPDNIDFAGELRREILEETGISSETITSCRLIGIAYDPEYCHPELFFLADCFVPADVLRGRMKTAKSGEYGHLRLVPRAALSESTPEPRSWSYRQALRFLEEIEPG